MACIAFRKNTWDNSSEDQRAVLNLLDPDGDYGSTTTTQITYPRGQNPGE